MKKMQSNKETSVLISAGSISPGDARGFLGSSGPWGLIGGHSLGAQPAGDKLQHMYSLTYCGVQGDQF